MKRTSTRKDIMPKIKLEHEIRIFLFKMHFPNKALQNWFLKIKDKWFRLAILKCLNEKTHTYRDRDRHKYGRFDALTRETTMTVIIFRLHRIEILRLNIFALERHQVIYQLLHVIDSMIWKYDNWKYKLGRCI